VGDYRVLTFDDLQQIGQAEVLMRQGKLTYDAVIRDGTDANILTAVSAAMGEEVVAQQSQAVAGSILDAARGDALDRLVWDRYNLLREPAAPARGTVQFRSPTALGAQYVISKGTLVSTVDGIKFATTADCTIPLGSAGPIDANVQSLLAGEEQQATKSTITSILSQLPAAPVTFTVTNALATAGAADREEDDALRARAHGFYPTLGKGTLAAIEQGAKMVAGVRTAKAFDGLDADGHPARYVTLVVSDAMTVKLADLAPTPPVYAAQSSALANEIDIKLKDYRAGGIWIYTVIASVVMQQFTLQLIYRAGVDTNVVRATAVAAVVNYTNTLRAGQTWVLLEARAALLRVFGLEETSGVAVPTGDIQPLPLEVIRTMPELVVG
jgi:hypothetical protein